MPSHPLPSLHAPLYPAATLREEMATLFAWRPLRWLAGIAAVALAVPAAMLMVEAIRITPGGLDIDTQGASGTILSDRLELDLPLTIRNGTERAIMSVSLWVEAYGCPAGNAPLSACTRIFSAEQSIARRIMPGSSASTAQTLSSGLPDHLAGRHLRITRKLETIEDDRDLSARLAEEQVYARAMADHDN